MFNFLANNRYINISPADVIKLEDAGVIEVSSKRYLKNNGVIFVYYVAKRKVIVDFNDIDNHGCVIGTNYITQYSKECDVYYYVDEVVLNWTQDLVDNYFSIKKELKRIEIEEKMLKNRDKSLEALLSQKLKEIKK